MKCIVFLATLLFLPLSSKGQLINPNLDTTLAKTLGADDYGMKSYVLVILQKGTNTTADQKTTDSLFMGHLKNINRLSDLKKLIVAGPLGKNDKNYRGIFILNIKSIEDAEKLLQTDPAVNGKLLEPLYFNWYGSAALSEYLTADDKIWKYKP